MCVSTRVFCNVYMANSAPLEGLEARFRSAHDLLARVALEQNCSDSQLVNSVSRHVLPSTASFANLAALLAAAQQAGRHVEQRPFVATSGRRLVFSCKFDGVSQAGGSRAAAPASANKKRKRTAKDRDEAHAEELTSARKRLATSCAATPLEELDAAQQVISRVQQSLRGPAGELVVESYAMMTRKLHPSDSRPSVVIALRINAGIPISLPALKRCLGGCWRDGVVSSEPSVNGVCEADLPVGEECAASREQGNAPMLIVTSVPLVADPAAPVAAAPAASS